MAYGSGADFLGDEQGGMGWSLVWTVVFLISGGLAIDASNAWRVRSMLQATADSAAHAGAMQLPNGTTAVNEAMRIAQSNLSVDSNGEVTKADDVEVGRWDMDSHTLIVGHPFPDAVRARALRTAENSNRVDTFLLRLAAFGSWDVSATSTVQRFTPGCLKDGLITRDMVELSSGNNFLNGICIHGELGVKLSIGNSFGDDVVVSMEDLDTLQLPADQFDSNPGLLDALTEGSMEPRLVSLLPEIINALDDASSDWQPSYIDKSTASVISVNQMNFDASTLVSGNIYNVHCNGANPLMLDNITLERMVIVTNCKVQLNSGVRLYDTTIATSNTSDLSFTGSEGVMLGRADDCAPGGGAQLLTLGGAFFAAKMQYHGSQIVAQTTVTMAAQVEGITGTSVQSGGEIKLTSESSFGTCLGVADEEYAADYYRIVE